MKKTADRGLPTADRALGFVESDATTSTGFARTRTASNARQSATGSKPLRSASIEVHIDELVLHGFAHEDRRPIADAIERELSSLFALEGLPVGQSFEAEHMNGGTFRVADASRQESAGRNVARAIYGGLRR